METRVIQRANNYLAIGLSWRSLSVMEPERSEINRFAREKRSNYGAICRTDDESTVGFVSSGFKVTKKLVPAALWLSKALLTHSILIEPLGNDEYWYVAISEGHPVPGSDKVVDFSEALHLANDLLTFKAFTIYCGEEFKEHFPTISTKTFDEIVNATTPPGYVRQIAGLNYRYILIGLLIISLASIAYWGYLEKRKYDQATAAAKARALLIEAEKQAALQSAKAPTTITGSDVKEYAARDEIAAYMQAIKTQNVTQAGWLLERLECIDGSCTLNWKRTLGTTADFVKLLPDRSGLTIAPDGESISQKIFVKIGAEKRQVNVKDLVNFLDVTIDVGSMIQKYKPVGVSGMIQEAQPATSAQVTSTPTSTGAVKNGAPTAPPVSYKKGRWEIKGPLYSWEIAKRLPDCMMLSRLSVVFSGTTSTWQGEGLYVVK